MREQAATGGLRAPPLARALPMRYAHVLGTTTRAISTRIRLATIASLLGPIAVYAQNGQVSGRVTDTRTAQPIVAATIEIVGTRQGALTDSDGRFRVLAVPPGTHVVTARRVGYASMRQSVSVAANGQASADFALTTSLISLDQIVVTGTTGAERLRTIGSSVATINAPAAVDWLPEKFAALLSRQALPKAFRPLLLQQELQQGLGRWPQLAAMLRVDGQR